MTDQDDGQLYVVPRPTTNNKQDWMLYWMDHRQPWRIEPEIEDERQKYLEKHRYGVLEKSTEGKRKFVFPLRDIALSRADIEWLLPTRCATSLLKS